MRAQIECGTGGRRAGGAPFIPLDGRVANEPSELLGERAAREGDGEAALLLDGLLLCFYGELREPVDELGRGGEDAEDGGTWCGVRHRDECGR